MCDIEDEIMKLLDNQVNMELPMNSDTHVIKALEFLPTFIDSYSVNAVCTLGVKRIKALMQRVEHLEAALTEIIDHEKVDAVGIISKIASDGLKKE